MGQVFLAEDLSLGRHVAIKLVSERVAGDATVISRFSREARLLATIEHSHVVRVYSFGMLDDQPYLVMEYVEGRSLGEHIRQNSPLPISDVLRILREACDGLDAAQELNIIHRDIKPANILLDRRGRVRVADFGLAKRAATGATDGDSSLTQSGYLVGSPHYLSPEQAQGEPTDLRSDIYSLGVVLYEMLTGERPFTGTTPIAVVAKHLHDPLPPVALKRPDVPADLARLVERMTCKNRDERPQSYAELVREIDRVASGPPDAAETLVQGFRTVPAAVPKPASRRWHAIAISGALFAALLIAIVLWRRAIPTDGFRAAKAVRSVAVAHAGLVNRIASRAGASAPRGRVTATGPITVVRSGATSPQITIMNAVVTQSDDAVPIRIAGLTFFVAAKAPKEIEIHAPPDQAEAAAQAVRLYDALFENDFKHEANDILKTGDSRRQITVDVHGVPPLAIVELIASAAGWPVVIDPSAIDQVQRILPNGPARTELKVTAPWDAVVAAILNQYDLRLHRLESTWLVVSASRGDELDARRTLVCVYLPTPADLDGAAKAMSVALSPRGTLLINRRLHGLVVTDSPQAVTTMKGILTAFTAIDGGDRSSKLPHPVPASEHFSGATIDVKLFDADVRDFLAPISELIGVNLVLDPSVKGRLTMHFHDIPWDEAMESAMALTRYTYSLNGNVLSVIPESKLPKEEVVVETVKLRREDPAFFAPWGASMAPRGSLTIDRGARLLVIRNTKSKAAAFRALAERIDGFSSPDVVRRIEDTIAARGVDAGFAMQQRLAKTDRDFDLSEGDLNAIGYGLMAKKRLAEATDVFRRVAIEYPKSANAYDSLAEAYMNGGHTALAITNYRKSLELNPANENARAALAKFAASAPH